MQLAGIAGEIVSDDWLSGEFFRGGQQRVPRLREAAARHPPQRIRAVQRAGRITGRDRQLPFGDGQGFAPVFLVGAQQPAGFEHGRMRLPRGRDGIQLGAGVGGAAEAEPAERRVQAVDVGQFKHITIMHADRKTVAQRVGKRRRQAFGLNLPRGLGTQMGRFAQRRETDALPFSKARSRVK